MNTELTKDAQKLVALLYKSYLERRKSGMSKANAKFFEPSEYMLSPMIPPKMWMKLSVKSNPSIR